MKHYTISRVGGRPDWNAIPALAIDEQHWRPPVDISATAQLAWDDERLYVRMQAVEKAIRAEHTGPLGMPCEDSCLEFFFSPTPGDPRYFNVEYNPNASLYLGFGADRDGIRLIVDQGLFKPRTARTDDGWLLEYEVPYTFVRVFMPGFRPAPGGTMRANCYKCGDLTPAEHYLAWNPCTGDTPDFHRPQDFGLMTFG